MPRSASEIPTDVVRQIFAVFARTLSVKRPALFPWFLGHICSTWRSVFLSMNTVFWHKISIDDLTYNRERTIDIIRFFLEHDPAAPFSFYITWDGPKSDRHICKVMEMLADQSMRWKTATIYIPIQQMLPLVRIKNRIPLLQELWITTTSYHQDEYIHYEELKDIFWNAPSLGTIKIDILRDWEFDLSNLKAIDVSNGLGDATFFFAALPQMTKLERLEFGGTYDWIPGHATPSNAIVLPNLTKLTCGKPDWLQFLKVPSLEGLFIECNNSARSDSVVLSFLSRNLNISSLGISRALASTVIKFVRNAPQITYLQLKNIHPISDTLKQLAIPTSPIQEALAPHTQSLRFACNFSRDDLDLLYDLVSSRTDSTTGHYKRLQKLEIVCSRFSVPAITKSISALLCAERGVELDFIH